MSEVSLHVISLLSAELLLLLSRSADVVILAKRFDQRSARETHRVVRGLARALILESVVFVPASVTLLLLLSPLVIGPKLLPSVPIYAALGLVSYGFPFVTVKVVITRVALNTLREFAALAPSAVEEELSSGHERK